MSLVYSKGKKRKRSSGSNKQGAKIPIIHVKTAPNGKEFLKAVKYKDIEYFEKNKNYMKTIEIIDLSIDYPCDQDLALYEFPVILDKYFPNLKKLNLYQHDIQELKDIDGFDKLEYLNLGFNYMKSISGIKGFKNVKTLNLYCNRIEYIDCRHYFKNVTYLDIRQNMLEQVKYIQGFLNVSTIRLGGNRFETNRLKKLEEQFKNLQQQKKNDRKAFIAFYPIVFTKNNYIFNKDIVNTIKSYFY